MVPHERPVSKQKAWSLKRGEISPGYNDCSGTAQKRGAYQHTTQQKFVP